MLLLLALLACDRGSDTEPEVLAPVVPGAPLAGAAEGLLRLPVGTPLGGFTSRCSCMGGSSGHDDRESPYQTSFVPSSGVHTRPSIKVLWIDNGDVDLVLLKTDLIYSFDGLVASLTDQLEAATGEELDGRVVVATSHTHNSYGPFSAQVPFFLGGDRYDEEIFQRMVGQFATVALEAYDARQPAALGLAWARDWDPDDHVYRDRRGENDDLVPEGWEEDHGRAGKDPHVALLRVDTVDGDPLAMVVNFGMHGIMLGGNSPLVSSDSVGGLEAGLQESFDDPVVVMHLQGAVGDASPAGSSSGLARVETIGEYARDPLMELWASADTSADPIRLETVSRHVPQSLDEVHVDRDGLVDWHYPYEPTIPDGEIYGPSGELLTPFDEFNFSDGGVFCGGSGDDPYFACQDMEDVLGLITAVFDLEDEPDLPLLSTQSAGTTVTRIGPLVTRLPDGTTVEQDLLAGFFPAEPTALYTEQWRRRVEAELGYAMPMAVGTSQDHEGYFLLPEDWLRGGYEPNISTWGPLGAEYVMEEMIDAADEVLSTDVHEHHDPSYEPAYPVTELKEHTPDATPLAGTRLDVAPDELWVPLDLPVHLEVADSYPRVQGIVQLAWQGGDPAVDSPRVVLEREEAGAWVEVTSHSGRPITEAYTDILLGWTPVPLEPHTAEQEHLWIALWQAVGHVRDRTGLPEGTYRLHATGQRYTGTETTWPYTTEPYEVMSDAFEIEPGVLDVAEVSEGLEVWFEADGWRLVHVDGVPDGDNPAVGPFVVTWDRGTAEVDGVVRDRHTFLEVALPDDPGEVTVTDPWGNHGWLE